MITGGSSGIGKAIALALGAKGVNVAINFHSDEKSALRVQKKIIEHGSSAITVQADISKESDVVNMFGSVLKKYGTLDILINNAGIQKDSKLTEMSLDDWNQVISVNLTGQFLCAREACKEFIKRGLKNERSSAAGKIIFISSVHNVIPWAGHDNYSASKGGETMLMKSIAQEMAPYKIRVNSIAPGAIKTDINKKVWSDPVQEKKLLKLIPYGRLGNTDDVANLAVWLASDQADYITGTTIYIDGGMTLYPSFAHGG